MAHNLLVWGLTVFAAFGGFMFGYDIGIINGVKEMCGFRVTFNLPYMNTTANGSSGDGMCARASCTDGVADSTILGLIVSVFSLGCLVGALIAGVLSDWIGRKLAIMVGGAIFLVGGILQASAVFLWMILIGRIVSGIGVGVLSMVVPIYNAELAPKTLRGRLVSLNQLAITAGIMVSFLVNLAVQEVLVGWRISLGLQVLLALILIVGMLFLPETPRWLVKKNRQDKALQTLSFIRHSTPEEVKEEYDEIISSSRHQSQAGLYSLVSTLGLIIERRIFFRVMMGVCLQLFQQFTGINVIMYYSTSIFCQIGVKEYLSTALVGTLNFLTTILSIILVDKIGRKALLLLGALGMFLSLVAAASIIIIWRVGSDGDEEVAGYMVVLSICFFVFNFAYSWGPVAWVVTSEIFPLNLRSASVSITTAANWMGNFLVAMLTPILIASPLGIYGTFYLVSGFLAAAFLFVLLTLPETKGLSLERIEEVFVLSWNQRTRVKYYLTCGCPWNWRGGGESRVLEFEQEKSDDTDKTTLLSDQHETTH